MKILVEHILPGLHYESISENSGGAYLVGGSTMNPFQEMLVEHVLLGAPPRYLIRKFWWKTDRQRATKIYFSGDLVELAMRYPTKNK